MTWLFQSQSVQLMNGSADDITVTPVFTGTHAACFQAQPAMFTLSSQQSKTISIVYCATELGSVQSTRCVIAHPAVGEWVYDIEVQAVLFMGPLVYFSVEPAFTSRICYFQTRLLQGTGTRPNSVQTITVAGPLQARTASSIQFTNPFEVDAAVTILVDDRSRQFEVRSAFVVPVPSHHQLTSTARTRYSFSSMAVAPPVHSPKSAQEPCCMCHLHTTPQRCRQPKQP